MIQHIDPQPSRRTSPGTTAPGPGAEASRVGQEPGSDEGDPIEGALANLWAIGENMRRLMILRAERRRLRVRRWILLGITVALVAIAVVPLVIAGVMRFVTGMAQGFGLLWSGRPWLGDLTTGVVILGGVALLVAATSSWLSRKGLWKKEAELERETR